MKNKEATNKNLQKKAMSHQLTMKKGKNVMKNKRATNKNIQNKARSLSDVKTKAPPRLKDPKNLERATEISKKMKMKMLTKGKKRGPRTPMLKGPLMPDGTLVPETEWYQTFQLTCMIIPPGRLVVGVVP